ncbi:hypothetical protein SLE2022_055820 [Rubroshorea leprosula]
MATRLGAHAVGVAHCNFFVERLSDFQGTGSPDPSMDPALAAKLRQECSMVGDTTEFLDQNSSFVVDNQYYKQILLKRGILQIDQELANDTKTRWIVSGFASNNIRFSKRFADAMAKLGTIEVLVGNDGEIRKNCRASN